LKRKDRSAPPQPLAAGTAERLAAIVEAAEQAAVTVIDDAEKQARRHLEEAEAEAERIVSDRLDSLSDLTDSLVAQAEAIRGQSEQLLSSLAEVKRRLAADGVPARPDETRPVEPPARPSHLSAVASPEEPAEEPTELKQRGDERGTPAGARLLATQMAVSGNSREEIEARLRNGFEIEDTDSILDAILGPEE
jgi:vacuolar-type H+-ATPase subunit H